MRLDVPLLKLPLRFDSRTLAAEIAALPPEAWVPHPDKLPGNAAVRLVTPGGGMTDDISGTMAPTKYLLACPYIIEAMAAIGAVWGRSRLMRLTPGAVVPVHVDTNFYWRKHVRIHVPIVTTPEVLFSCSGQTVHMAAGECWSFDTFSLHQVRNLGARSRVHLVIDTAGSEQLFDLIAEARAAGPGPADATARLIAPGTTANPELMLERAEPPGVMSPWELRGHIAFIGEKARPDPLLPVIMRRLERFAAGWAGTWARYATSAEGSPAYRGLIARLEADLAAIGGQRVMLRNNLPVYRQIHELLVTIVASIPASAAAGRPGPGDRIVATGAAR